MKTLTMIVAIVLSSTISFAAGRLQNEDFKTLAEIQAASGTAAQLLNDTKVYITANGINKQLSSAITEGNLTSAAAAGIVYENFILNPFFEQSATANWTTSGAAAVSGAYSVPTANSRYFSQVTASVSGGYFQSNAVSMPTVVVSSTVTSTYSYQVVSGTWTAELITSGTTVASQTLTAGSIFNTNGSLFYTVDQAGASTTLRFTAVASSSVLRMDDVFVGKVSKGNVIAQDPAGPIRVETFSFGGGAMSSNCTGTPCTIHQQTGGIAAIARAATGQYILVFKANTFRTFPSCSGRAFINGTTGNATLNGPTNGLDLFNPTYTGSISLTIYNNATGAAADGVGTMTCVGITK